MTPALTDLTWPVATERLSIRPAVASDAAAMFGYRGLEEVSRWLPTWCRDQSGWTSHFASMLGRQLVVELDGILVGDLYLDVQDAWSQTEVRDRAVGTQAEIGYVLDPMCAGRGLATEAVRALLEIAFEGIGVRRVVAQCFAENEASWRLMERIGKHRETHTVAESLHRDGRWLDGLAYAMLREEWLSSGR